MNRLTSGERLYRLCDPEPTLDLETNVDVITEMRRIAGTMWTREIDAMLVADIQQLVSRLSSGNVIVLCALKYHCTPEDIEERMEVILAMALQGVKDKWANFQENRCGSVSRHVAGHDQI
jgi:hypothetical protein